VAIAIENARLLKELRERTDQVEAQSQEVAKQPPKYSGTTEDLSNRAIRHCAKSSLTRNRDCHIVAVTR